MGPATFMLLLPLAAARPPSSTLLDEARLELQGMQATAASVTDRRARRHLESRIQRMDRLLARAIEASASEEPFEGAVAAVLTEEHDNERLDVIERLAGTRSFTTEEATTLAGLCTFDSTRAEALLVLHGSVEDPWRYAEALHVLDLQATRAHVAHELSLDTADVSVALGALAPHE